MASNKWDGKIPFTADGSPVSYDHDWQADESRGGSRRDNTPFMARGVYQGYGRGRSAAYFCYDLHLSDGKVWSVNMFMTEFNRVVCTHGLVKGGDLSGHWKFQKMGSNYAIQYLGPDA